MGDSQQYFVLTEETILEHYVKKIILSTKLSSKYCKLQTGKQNNLKLIRREPLIFFKENLRHHSFTYKFNPQALQWKLLIKALGLLLAYMKQKRLL